MIEAVPEDPELKAEILGAALGGRARPGDHHVQHLVAADRPGSPESVERARALPRRALVQPAGVDPGHRGDRRAGDEPRRRSSAIARRSCARSASSPAEVADRAGFVSNRLQMALLREALAIVEEGQTTREDLDDDRAQHVRLPAAVLRAVPDRATWPGSTPTSSVFETLEREVGPEFAAAAGAARAGRRRPRSARRAARASTTYSDEERDALLLERDRRYAALAEAARRAGRRG